MCGFCYRLICHQLQEHENYYPGVDYVTDIPGDLVRNPDYAARILLLIHKTTCDMEKEVGTERFEKLQKEYPKILELMMKYEKER